MTAVMNIQYMVMANQMVMVIQICWITFEGHGHSYWCVLMHWKKLIKLLIINNNNYNNNQIIIIIAACTWRFVSFEKLDRQNSSTSWELRRALTTLYWRPLTTLSDENCRPGSQRGALGQAMVTSHLTGTDERSWSEECVHAGIFSLFGLGCSHTPASKRHPFWIHQSRGGPSSKFGEHNMDVSDPKLNASGSYEIHSESLRHSSGSDSLPEDLGGRFKHSDRYRQIKGGSDTTCRRLATRATHHSSRTTTVRWRHWNRSGFPSRQQNVPTP